MAVTTKAFNADVSDLAGLHQDCMTKAEDFEAGEGVADGGEGHSNEIRFGGQDHRQKATPTHTAEVGRGLQEVHPLEGQEGQEDRRYAPR